MTRDEREALQRHVRALQLARHEARAPFRGMFFVVLSYGLAVVAAEGAMFLVRAVLTVWRHP